MSMAVALHDYTLRSEANGSLKKELPTDEGVAGVFSVSVFSDAVVRADLD